MTEWFISFLGKYARVVIDFYRDNQTWLNLLVLVYGIMLAWAHRNTLRVIALLKEIHGVSGLEELQAKLESSGIDEAAMKKLKGELFLPLMSSRYHLFFNSLSGKGIIQQIKYKIQQEKKHG